MAKIRPDCLPTNAKYDFHEYMFSEQICTLISNLLNENPAAIHNIYLILPKYLEYLTNARDVCWLCSMLKLFIEKNCVKN